MEAVVSFCFTAGMLVTCAQVDALWQLTIKQYHHYGIRVTVATIFRCQLERNMAAAMHMDEGKECKADLLVIGVPHIVLAIAPVVGTHHSIVPLSIIWPEHLALLTHPSLRLLPRHLNPKVCICHNPGGIPACLTMDLSCLCLLLQAHWLASNVHQTDKQNACSLQQQKLHISRSTTFCERSW
jgi:hypothetical protein